MKIEFFYLTRLSKLINNNTNSKIMKKGMILVAGIAIFAFSSCRKDYTCTCIDSDDGYTVNYTFTNTKKDLAEASCSAYNYNGPSYNTVCTIK